MICMRCSYPVGPDSRSRERHHRSVWILNIRASI
ncbi:hypothetical protein PVAP13_3NG144301 [Panicum virgatum]|uniref:Uncharacterized protein n=1 Tax=Panicum virgatum TaxID=38727 RepID=A0A8T0UGB7_PANVG|nr:hypothetical protein PVAP13_3NG144301 [Panicum virgatum]